MLTAPARFVVNFPDDPLDPVVLPIEGLSVSDADAAAGDATVLHLTIQDAGVLRVGPGGIDGIVVAGNESGDVTLSGGFAQVSQWLSALSADSSLDFVWEEQTYGAATLTVAFSDGEGADDACETQIPIKINAVPHVVNVGMTVAGGTRVVITEDHLRYADEDNTDDEVLFTIESLPVKGILLIGGRNAVVGDVFSQADLYTFTGETGLVYAGSGETAAQDQDGFTYSVSDGDGGDLFGRGFTILIQDTQPTPVIHVPAPIIVNEGMTIGLTGVSADASGTDLSLTLSLSEGSAGLMSFGGGDLWTAEKTITGSLADVNTALAGLSYCAGVEAGPCEDAVVITLQSGTLTAEARFAITVNDIPVLAVNAGLTVHEGASAIISSELLRTVQGEDSPLTYTVVTAPANGVLEIEGTVLSPGMTFTQARIDAGLLVYVHGGGENVADGFTFTVSDGLGGDIGVTAFAIVVIPVNNPPVVHVPGNMLVNEGTTTPINGISVTDSDAFGTDAFIAGLSLADESAGQLWMVSMGNAVVTGKYSSSVMISGTLDDINATLATVRYVTPFGAYDRPFTDVLTVTANDLGHNGEGGPKEGTAAIAITVNHIPEVAVNTGASLSQMDSMTVTAAMLRVVDVDAAPDALVYTITAIMEGVLAKDGSACTPGDTFTQADIDAGFIRFTHDGSPGSNGGFTFTVSDGRGGLVPETTFAITITDNTLPWVASNTGGAVLEGGTLDLMQAALEVKDLEQGPALLVFTIIGTSGGCVERDGVTLFAGDSFTQADVNGGLVRFVHGGGQEAEAGFAASVSDGAGGAIATVEFLIQVTPVEYKTQAGAIFLAVSGVTIPDPGGASLQVTVTLALSVADAAATLRVGAVNGVTIAGNYTAVIVMTGALADVNQAMMTLEIIEIRPGVGVGACCGHIAIEADNGAVWNKNVYFKFNATPVSAAAGTLSVDESGTAVLGQDVLRTTDSDNNRYELTYTVLTAPLQGALLYAGSTPLVTGDAFTQADVDNGLIAYVHGGSEDALTDGLALAVSDGDGGSIPSRALQIAIAPVNNPPILNVPDTTTSPLLTNVGIPRAVQGIVIIDRDAGDGTITLTASLASADPDRAFLTVQPAGSATVEGQGTWIVKITGPLADVQWTVTGLVYTPVADAGYFNDEITVLVEDNGNAGSGGSQSATASIRVQVNDVPAPFNGITTARIVTGGGAIDVEAVNGAITMADGALVSSSGVSPEGMPIEGAGGDIRLSARTDMALGWVHAGSSSVSLTATEGSILNGAVRYDRVFGVPVVDDAWRSNVSASAAVMNAGIGIGVMGDVTSILYAPDPLLTSIGIVAARAGEGGINILEKDDIIVDDVTTTIRRVLPDGTVNEIIGVMQSDLVTSSNGAIVLRTDAGDITLNDGAAVADNTAVRADGTGNILVETVGAGTNSIANARIISGTGHITVAAADSITFTGVAGISTGGAGTVFVHALSGSVTMADESSFMAVSGDIRVCAEEGITLSGIVTTAGVSLIAATGSIIDGGESFIDVTADTLRMIAGVGIGTASDHIETAIAAVSAHAASGGIFILESDIMIVESADATIQKVRIDGGVTPITDAPQSDVATTSGDGSIVLTATLGDITLNDGDANGTAVSADGTGNILLQALAGAITANADILSGTGHITIKAAQSISLNAGVDVSTAVAGTASLEAAAGFLAMAGDATVTATGSAVRLSAAGDLTVGNLAASDVSLITRGSLVNAADSTKNVTATHLRIESAGSIGTAGRHLTTSIDKVSALSGTGSIWITEDDGATIDSVSVAVTEFNADGTTTAVTDGAQSDLTTGADGSIVLVATLGDITLNDGDANGTSASADGTGNILLQALAGSIVANDDILSGTGHITIKAAQSISLNAGVDVSTAAAGTASLEAAAGFLAMAGDATVTATGSAVRLSAAGDLTVGNLTASDVSLITSGAIINAADSTKNVTATHLRIESAGSIGTAGRHLTTHIDTVSALSGTGSIWITEDDGATIDSVSVAVTEFNADGTTTAVTDGAQSDLTTARTATSY